MNVFGKVVRCSVQVREIFMTLTLEAILLLIITAISGDNKYVAITLAVCFAVWVVHVIAGVAIIIMQRRNSL